METLQRIYDKHIGPGGFPDKGTVHSYIEEYSARLEPYRFTAKAVLEIGIFSGESLRMWEEYFENAEVHGIDCSDQPHGGMVDLRPMIAEGTHNISIIDATDLSQVKKTFTGKKFDVIIEDASHQLAHQLGIYEIFKNYLNDGGIYIIEDVDKLDEVRHLFENIDPTKKVEILDRRSIKGRFDDVLVVIS
jgi:cephalosporin hydroxylase